MDNYTYLNLFLNRGIEILSEYIFPPFVLPLNLGWRIYSQQQFRQESKYNIYIKFKGTV